MGTQIFLSPTKNPQIFKVQLNLTFQTRHIGKIDFSGDGTFRTQRKKKHLHNLTQSLGLNYELLYNKEISYKWIKISYQDDELITSREYFKTYSNCFQFKGFEKQKFLSLDLFGYDEALKFEQNREVQQDLFPAV